MKIINSKLLLVAGLAFISLNSKAQITKSEQNITFTRFQVTEIENNNKVAIEFATDGSVPTNYFEVQRSADGVNYKTIALILGPDPKQTTCDCYGCFDKMLKAAGKSLYRAKHIASDGSEQLSSAQSAKL